MKAIAVASATVVALAMAACGGDNNKSDNGTGGNKTTVKVGLAYDIGGRGDKSFNDAAHDGLEKLKSDTASNVTYDVRELEAKSGETENDKYTRLTQLCKGGYNIVIAVGFVYAGADAKTGPVAKAAADCPDTKFAIIDDGSVAAPNVANLVFAEEQGSFLVGAAAALKTKTKNVGFVGGCDVDLIHKFEAGYKAGVMAVDPTIKVQSNYISTIADGCSGFNDPAKGKTAAEGMYDGGADIVYQAAGGSGVGVFQAAAGKGKLAIGVDSDQYNTVGDPALQAVILTSMLKRVDVAVYEFVKSIENNTFKAGPTVFDLKVNGVGYSTSGGKVDDIKSKLDDYKAKIVSGQITVPTK
jgi:basic membrane protein A